MLIDVDLKPSLKDKNSKYNIIVGVVWNILQPLSSLYL